MPRILTPLALGALVSACGPLNDGGVGQQFAEMVQSRVAAARGTAPAAPALPPEIANAQPGEVLLVSLLARDAVAPMVRFGQNGDTITWISPGKVSLSFTNGLLVSTRGLGNDLMGVTLSGVSAAIRAGGGAAKRQHSYLDGEDNIVTAELDCTIASVGTEEVMLANGPRALRKMTESCRGRRLAFENSYWVDDAGVILRSRQAISPAEGFMQVDQL